MALILALYSNCVHARADDIEPYVANPRYWQYKGQPVLLLGGSKDDSLFQIPDLKEHLDEIRAAGGNYIRNTMSDRHDHDFEVYPFRRLDNGKYDLTQFNDEYWQRFANLLKWTEQRDIIVQIEVWDRFDYTDVRNLNHWQPNPWRPANNVNYTAAESGFAPAYRDHPSRDRQPFFHTVPAMKKYQKKYDVIRQFQERFVDKMLHYSLQHGNVLYCMNNETSTDPKWGQHWMQFIRGRAAKAGKVVYATDMFDDVYKGEQSATLKMQFDSPQMYPYIDISQVNSRNFNEDHWDKLIWMVQQRERHPRPLNHTKIYSAGQTSFGSGTPVDGVERFWRNLIAGSASSRFHRPTSGIGINNIAKACIGAARKAESVIKFWNVEPHMELLQNREADEAYLAAKPGSAYLLYFTDGGEVGLDMSDATGVFDLKWIDIGTSEWAGESKLPGGAVRTIRAPKSGGWVATLTLKSGS